MNFEECLQLAAQAWCGEDTSHIEVDSLLGHEFACILKMETDRARREALDEAIKVANEYGCVTAADSIKELKE